jgi:hypothetical protein
MEIGAVDDEDEENMFCGADVAITEELGMMEDELDAAELEL